MEQIELDNKSLRQLLDIRKSEKNVLINDLKRLTLQNEKLEKAINDIKHACEYEFTEGYVGYVVDTSIILHIINELEK